MGKTTFPKDFFHKIWLIIGDCRYNYIVEIQKVIRLRFYGENTFWKKREKCFFLPPKEVQRKVRQSHGRAVENNVLNWF